ncbi:MAG: hypothetical protein AB2705_18915 [Candidatus Thiodiazotropha sp.]
MIKQRIFIFIPIFSVLIIAGLIVFFSAFALDVIKQEIYADISDILNKTFDINGFAAFVGIVISLFLGYFSATAVKLSKYSEAVPDQISIEKQSAKQIDIISKAYNDVLLPLQDVIGRDYSLSRIEKEARNNFPMFLPVCAIKFGSHSKTTPLPRDRDIAIILVGKANFEKDPLITGVTPHQDKSLYDLVLYDFTIAAKHLCIGNPFTHSLVKQSVILSGESYFIDILKYIANRVVVKKIDIVSFLELRTAHFMTKMSAVPNKVPPFISVIYSYWITTIHLQLNLLNNNDSEYLIHDYIASLADLNLLRESITDIEKKIVFNRIVQQFKGLEIPSNHEDVRSDLSKFLE